MNPERGMTMVRKILLLGDPKLYETSAEVTPADAPLLAGWIADLHDTLMEYRRVYGAGRAVAAPQIGVQKRLLYMFDNRPYVFVNPSLTFPDGEKYELMAKKQFKAESKRLLDLMINSIYTHQEIFLREIISNASDAIDKLAYTALTDEKVGLNRSDFAIRITADEKNRLLTVSDNGIGMNCAGMTRDILLFQKTAV